MQTVYHAQRRLLLAAMSILATLTAAEFSLARWLPQRTLGYLKKTHLSCYRESERLPYEFRRDCRGQFLTASGQTSHVRINNIGFRGPDVGDKHGSRVLFVGDSYVFGYGVEEEDAMPAFLEEELGVEVVNAGIWGVGPDVEYLVAERLVGEIRPDVLLLGIFPENDLRDLTETTWVSDDDGSLRSVKNDKFVDSEGFLWRDAVSRRYYLPVVNNSHFIALLWDRLSEIFSALRMRLTGWTPPRDPKLARLGPYEKRLDVRWDYSCLYELRCEGPLGDARRKAELVFDRFKELSGRFNVPLVTVIIPYRPQMTGEEPIETIFNRLSEERGFPVVDLAESMKESGLAITDIYQVDDHFSPRGNHIAAQAIARVLRDERIFPSLSVKKR